MIIFAAKILSVFVTSLKTFLCLKNQLETWNSILFPFILENCKKTNSFVLLVSFCPTLLPICSSVTSHRLLLVSKIRKNFFLILPTYTQLCREGSLTYSLHLAKKKSFLLKHLRPLLHRSMSCVTYPGREISSTIFAYIAS